MCKQGVIGMKIEKVEIFYVIDVFYVIKEKDDALISEVKG
jgi:hypothetical protein